MLGLSDVADDLNKITGIIVDLAIAIHRQFGPGPLEGAYKVIMVHGLRARGLAVRTEVLVPVEFQGATVATGFRIDLLVEDRVIVELKAVERLMPVHRAQVLTYLKLSGRPVGLLINFNEAVVANGIRRFVNTTNGGNAESAESAETSPAPIAGDNAPS